MANRFASALLAVSLVSICTPNARGDLIVDNFSEQSVVGYGLRAAFFNTSTTWAQQFNTAGTDYWIESVSVRVQRDTPNADFTAQLWTSSGGSPLSSVTTFSLANLPSPGAFETHVFRPDTPYLLEGSQDYFFSIENNIGSTSILQGTVFGSNNFIGNGTLISNIVSSGDSGATWGFGGPNEMAIRITGSVPEPSSAICCGLIVAFGAVTRRRTSRS